jgi:predicted RNase H-like nuclease (RuvC/YqgF family)
MAEAVKFASVPKMEKLESEITRLTAKIAKLEGIIRRGDGTTYEIKRQATRIEGLETELAEARESTGRLEVKLFEQQSTNRKLEAELAEMKQRERICEEVYQAFRANPPHDPKDDRIEELEAELAEARNEWQRLALYVAQNFDEECADAEWSDIPDFDPWDCIRTTTAELAEARELLTIIADEDGWVIGAEMAGKIRAAIDGAK